MSQLQVTKGQPATFNIVVNRNGAPVNLTGASLTFQARVEPSDAVPLISKSIGNGIIVTNALLGQATLTILGADTSGLSVTQLMLFYKLTLTDGSGPDDVSSGTLQVQTDTTSNLYITVQDVRDAGLPIGVASDAFVLASIKLWQKFLERACRQWFYPLELELNLDGTDSDALHFGVPIISIEEVRLNLCPTALDPRYYKVYNALVYPADHQNPRIKLIDTRNNNLDIFAAPDREGRMIFRRGRQNQYVKGVFGYIEADGSPPDLIKHALLKLVIQKLTTPLYVDASSGQPAPTPPHIVSGIVTEEWTDGHRLKYSQAGGELKARAPGLAGITDDQEILNIIKLYKAPIGCATPNNPSYMA